MLLQLWSCNRSYLSYLLSLEQVADPTGFIKKAVEQASLCSSCAAMLVKGVRSVESLSLLSEANSVSPQAGSYHGRAFHSQTLVRQHRLLPHRMQKKSNQHAVESQLAEETKKSPRCQRRLKAQSADPPADS